MPKAEDELTDDELEVVVGGAMDKYYAIKVVREYLNEEKKISVTSRLAPKKELNPKIWDDKDQLYKDIKDKLQLIAEEFIKTTRGKDADIKDITFTGSLANFNYSDFSDIDLHILLDFKEIDEDVELVKDYFNAVKALWNYVHDIMIRGYEVEIYVQDINEPHASTGVYSIMNGDWDKKPVYKQNDIDQRNVDKKADSLIDQIKRAKKLMDEEKYEEAHERAISLMEKIKKMRQAGLEREGEYSVENLAFKKLRNGGYLAELRDVRNDSYDKSMSLDEKRKKRKKKKKKKDDRCTRIAKRKYDVWPSAYASGAVVKCRQGKIWKGVTEELDLTDSEVETLKKIKGQLRSSAKKHAKVAKMSTDSSELHTRQVDQIDDLIDEKKKKAKTDYSKEKKSGLHGWFQRQGGKGKSKGWVDCNTCRKDKKTGRKKCKPCGRKKGEKRSKYPACRPTPSACGTRGKGKKWGKKSGKTNENVDRIYNSFLEQELKPG